MQCPACGAEIADSASVCTGCGAPLPAIAPGTLLAGRYEIQELLGAGALGRVYRALDRTLNEVVAVKVLHPETTRSTEITRRFRNEIKLARRVRHVNVCAIHEYGEDGPLQFVAMELVDGADLQRALREKGPLPPAEIFEVGLQVVRGLAAIHDAGVIHRDLKTSNIVRDRGGAVRLLDFGIAKRRTPTGTLALTGVERVVGTPEYMSPEQIRGDDLDPRSDIYSFGVVLFELSTGTLPFEGKTPLDTMLRQVNEPPPLYGDRAARVPPRSSRCSAGFSRRIPEDGPAPPASSRRSCSSRGVRPSPMRSRSSRWRRMSSRGRRRRPRHGSPRPRSRRLPSLHLHSPRLRSLRRSSLAPSRSGWIGRRCCREGRSRGARHRRLHRSSPPAMPRPPPHSTPSGPTSSSPPPRAHAVRLCDPLLCPGPTRGRRPPSPGHAGRGGWSRSRRGSSCSCSLWPFVRGSHPEEEPGRGQPRRQRPRPRVRALMSRWPRNRRRA